MTEKEKLAIEAFFMEFNVKAHSYTQEDFSINPFTGTSSYENSEPYGDTYSLMIYHDDNEVMEIVDPKDNMKQIIALALKWYKADQPLPYKDIVKFNKFFNIKA